MLKLTLGECRNQIRYYKYIAYTFWEHLSYYSPQYCPSTSEDSLYPPHPAGQTACSCLSCENMQVGAQLCLQKCENVLSPACPPLPPIRWPLSVTFLHSMFCSVSIQRFSELGLLRFSFEIHTSLQMKISTASVSRSSRPLKGFSSNFLGAVLSTRSGKEDGHKHFMTKIVENVPVRVQWLRVKSIFPQAHRILSKGLTELHFFPQPCTFLQAHNVNHDLHRCLLIGQLRSSVVNQ